MKNKSISLKRLIKSFGYALNGIGLMIKQEQNAKIHLSALLIVVVLGFYFHLSLFEWISIVIVSGGVFAAEALNTSIETLSNTFAPEYNKNIKQVKDFAAGAVLVATITAIVVGLIIFVPKIIVEFNAAGLEGSQTMLKLPVWAPG
ncbi:MAG: diacylglycerol kinase family protein [Tannerella sp.]|jgi:diacylglycerol kinase|nr:diacylglycerol kinase family protein [Tannerella sp.]